MELLDSLARRYGARPSQVLGEGEEFKAFSIDLHAHNAGVVREQKAVWEQQQRRRRGR